MRCSSATFVGLAAPRRGSCSTGLTRCSGWRVSATRARAAAALAGGRRGGLGGGAQAGLAEVGGVGEAGGVALDDADAGATVAAAGDLLDPAVVEPRRRGALVLGVHLGELAAGAHRRTRAPARARRTRLRSCPAIVIAPHRSVDHLGESIASLAENLAHRSSPATPLIGRRRRRYT